MKIDEKPLLFVVRALSHIWRVWSAGLYSRKNGYIKAYTGAMLNVYPPCPPKGCATFERTSGRIRRVTAHKRTLFGVLL